MVVVVQLLEILNQRTARCTIRHPLFVESCRVEYVVLTVHTARPQRTRAHNAYTRLHAMPDGIHLD